jgi:16S rRNA (guanine1516-N2)-methyltransferase
MGNQLAHFIVTTSQRPNPETVQRAKAFSACYQMPYMLREGSLETISIEYLPVGVFVFTARDMFLWYQGREIRFHTNMAKHRILNVIKGGQDRMQTVMSLSPGDSMLDCTLGLGTDAIVASFIVGTSGKITGLESEYPLFLLVNHGFKEYVLRDKEYLTEPMRRIQVVHAESLEYLKSLQEDSYNVVYFDPMFRSPGTRSQGLEGLRMLSNPVALSQEHVAEAVRVSSRVVVLKERPGSREFARLGFSELKVTRGAAVSYGVIQR